MIWIYLWFHFCAGLLPPFGSGMYRPVVIAFDRVLLDIEITFVQARDIGARSMQLKCPCFVDFKFSTCMPGEEF
jgi:hypothetical protein